MYTVLKCAVDFPMDVIIQPGVILKKFTKLAAVALVASVAAMGSAGAQPGVDPLGGQWLGVTPTGAESAYWDHVSDDGLTCNIGYFVTTGFGPCSNEHPNPFASSLGWSGATYLATTPIGSPPGRVVFAFGAGNYDISYLGNVAGANPMRKFGISEIGSGSVNWLTVGSTTSYSSAAGFEFVLQAWSPTGAMDFRSKAGTRQLSVFANGTDGYSAKEFLVGSEDNACTAVGEGCARVSDYDFNDAMALVKVVPEPSTYALMATGLVGLFGVARRRRKA